MNFLSIKKLYGSILFARWGSILNNYNALLALARQENFDMKCEEMLNYVLAECSHHFERLPCVEDVEILRNILYTGVWDKFNQKRKKKDGE